MWTIGGIELKSRLFLGTARYPSPVILKQSIARSGCDIITVSLRREMAGTPPAGQRFWDFMRSLPVRVLPNTAGCRSVQEAVTTAEMARDFFDTTWIKLEVIGDDLTLQPDPFATVEAARILVKKGFEVFPYTTDDLVVALRLADVGCRIIMPWGAPIGTGQGLSNPAALKTLRQRLPHHILIVDAGLGRPSHAAQAMELGYDAVLLNTAVALSDDPPAMAAAFALATDAGRQAYEAGTMSPRLQAEASTPIVGAPFRP